MAAIALQVSHRHAGGWMRSGLIVLAWLVVGVMLVLPLAVVFAQALAKGWGVFVAALIDDDARDAMRLTLQVALIAVPANTVFGIAAAWAISHYRFAGRTWLEALIDLPFSVSPVVVGLVCVLSYGAHGWFGPWFAAHDIKVVFAVPGLVLVTVFVTFPFVARELIPVMQAHGGEEELAARTLGASGWQIFWRVSLPRVRWALLYGVLLCNARAMGEFGAVSVVSGHLPGVTSTLPLQVEQVYNGGSVSATTSAFALASLLALLTLVTLVVKRTLEWRHGGELAANARIAGERMP